MRKIKKEFTIYNYNELDEKVREKVLSDRIESDINFYCNDEYCLQFDMIEKAKELLKLYFENTNYKNCYYDLSYSQGSGAMIEFSASYNNKYFEVKHSGFYYHELSFMIDDSDDNFTANEIVKVKSKIIDMNRELSKYGYEMIERFNEADYIEGIKEELQTYEFYSDGSIYND